MRILTVLSGIILSAAGAFLFAFSTMLFSSLAFPVGCAMLISGLLILVAYLSSGRKTRLPDTMLVEGTISLLFGFAVLNNQVQDTMLATFFGAWLTIAGANRLSQAISVSRYKPKDYYKIFPLGLICTLLGAIMMMPTLYVGTPAIMLVALGFILNGLSLLVYAMYMKPPIQKQKEIEAQMRADARNKASEEKRKQQQKLRSLSREERLNEEEKIRKQKQAEKDKKRAEKKAQKDAAKAEKVDADKTVRLSDAEVEEINVVAEKTGYAQKVRDAEKAEEQELYPTFNNPTDIPSLRQMTAAEEEQTEAPEIVEAKLSAVNLEEIESKTGAVEFEEVELPDVKLESETAEAEARSEILKNLKDRASGIKKQEDDVEYDYTPITLEELLAETQFEKKTDPEDAKRFTQTLNLGQELKWSPDETK